MAYTIKRTTKRQDVRYTGMYKAANGRYKSAGTFDDEVQALEVAQQTEEHAQQRLATTSPAEKATITLDSFFEKFVREHGLEPNSRQGYAQNYHCHVSPYFGSRRLAELVDNELWNKFLTVELVENEVGPGATRSVRTVLSSMFAAAKRWGYISGENPIKGIRLIGGSSKGRRGKIIKVYTPDQYGQVRNNLPSQAAKRFSLLIANSGVRFCEAISFEVGDLDYETGLLMVNKSTVEVSAEYHPTGGRFVTRPYTKNGEERAFTIDLAVSKAIQQHVIDNNLQPGDLMFPIEMFTTRALVESEQELSDEFISTLGTFRAKVISPRTGSVTEREFRHGSMTAYATGKCRCRWCAQASRDYARNRKRKLRKTQRHRLGPNQRRGSDRHLSKDVWRRHWKAAVELTGIEYIPPYNVRHCHASWLIRNGADLARVQARLGHNDLTSTTRYVTVLDREETTSAEIMTGLMAGWGEL